MATGVVLAKFGVFSWSVGSIVPVCATMNRPSGQNLWVPAQILDILDVQ
jgi:hypothetical protein